MARDVFACTRGYHASNGVHVRKDPPCSGSVARPGWPNEMTPLIEQSRSKSAVSAIFRRFPQPFHCEVHCPDRRLPTMIPRSQNATLKNPTGMLCHSNRHAHGCCNHDTLIDCSDRSAFGTNSSLSHAGLTGIPVL